MYTQPVKTTVLIDPDLFYLARLKALEEKISFKELVNKSLRALVNDKTLTATKITWGGFKLGKVKGKLTRKEIYDYL